MTRWYQLISLLAPLLDDAPDWHPHIGAVVSLPVCLLLPLALVCAFISARECERVCVALLALVCVYAALPGAPVFLQTTACYLSSGVTQVGAPPAEVWGLTYDAAGWSPAWGIPQAAFASAMVVCCCCCTRMLPDIFVCFWAVYLLAAYPLCPLERASAPNTPSGSCWEDPVVRHIVLSGWRRVCLFARE